MRVAAWIAALALACPAPALSQGCTEDAMIVFDGSGSMAEITARPGATRIEGARIAMHRVLPQVAPMRRLGLVLYGPGTGPSCRVSLRMTPQPEADLPILAEIDTMEPAGSTALTAAVREAAEVLGDGPGTIVLVTDGEENCGGRPCLLAADLVAQRPNLTVHVIGYRIKGAFFEWRSTGGTDMSRATSAECLAHLTGGIYTTVDDTDGLTDALRDVLACPVFGAMARPSRDG